MNKTGKTALWITRIFLGTALFSVGFNMFLGPNDLNAGGLSGLAQLMVEVFGFGSVGLFVAMINLPLFALAGVKVGKRFFWGSLAGTLSLTLTLELLTFLPVPAVDPLLAALYGGVCAGVAKYFKLDPTIIRLVWALFCCTGSGILAYIIAALIMPVKPLELDS